MHEQITAQGWSWHGTCNCSKKGRIYRKGKYKLIHYFDNNSFWLGIKNSKIITGTNEDMMETIKKYV